MTATNEPEDTSPEEVGGSSHRTPDQEGPPAIHKEVSGIMAAINNPKDMRAEAPDGTYASPSRRDENDPEYNPYVAFAGMFKDSPFAAEVEAHWRAERQREREEAARLADLEDAQAAAEGGRDMAVTKDPNDVRADKAGDARHRQLTHDENDSEYNPYLALAGIFEDDPFADEVDAYVEAVRQRQRDEAAAEADREDAAKVAAEAD